MNPAKLSEVVSFGIFPAIGICRIGNSDEFFFSPEIEGIWVGEQPDNKPSDGSPFTFKDKEHKAKKQAARFRVYGYDAKGQVLGEIKLQQGVQIKWTVQVGNKKASHYQFTSVFISNSLLYRNASWLERSQLEYKGTQEISEPCPHDKGRTFDGKIYGGKSDELHFARMSMDSNGRLIFTGGYGVSKSIKNTLITQYANNDYWYDDTCDGLITAQVSIGEKQIVPHGDEGTAWVVVAPPKFAPDILPALTLYEVMRQTQGIQLPVSPKYPIDSGNTIYFYRDIYPMLEAAAGTAWVNQTAWKGHGHGSAGNFFNPAILEKLMNNTPQYSDERFNVFRRMRIPYSKSSSAVQQGQAFKYFMPALSGENGRNVDSDPNKWLTLTDDQYNRLERWAHGDFKVETPEERAKWTSFDEIPADWQPQSLNKASLDWCIGGGLHPGIEVSYSLKDPNNLSKTSPFRINPRAIKEGGDVTKWMALPWQADFNECFVSWWPYQRPDEVLPEQTFERIKNLQPAPTPEDFVSWNRGFRSIEPGNDRPHWGSMDMVEFWSKLGFVVPKKVLPSNDIWRVETERTLFDRTKLTKGATVTDTATPITKDDFRQMLQLALFVELTTIPAYLYAMYSIKTDTSNKNDIGPLVKRQISYVAQEEMLHASLVANIMVACGFKPIFYSREMTPFYPNPLPHYEDDTKDISKQLIMVHLQRADIDNIRTFVRIEAPNYITAPENSASKKKKTNVTLSALMSEGPVNPSIEGAAFQRIIAHVFGSTPNPNLAALQYDSIGAYYLHLISVMKKLHREGTITFDNGNDLQLEHGMGYTPKKDNAHGLIKVTDLHSAVAAMDLIIVQGEGGDPMGKNNPDSNDAKEATDVSNPDSNDANGSAAISKPDSNDSKGAIDTDRAHQQELSHYQRFLSILAKLESLTPDEAVNYQLYPVLRDPTADPSKSAYASRPDIQQVVIAFNACYCWLYLVLEQAWYTSNTSPQKMELIVGFMPSIMKGVLSPLADFIMSLSLNGQVNAAPTFEFYSFTPFDTPKSQVDNEIKKAAAFFLNSDAVASVASTIAALPDMGYPYGRFEYRHIESVENKNLVADTNRFFLKK